MKASECCAALIVGISKSQHPGRNSLQELGKALGDLKLSDTWLTNSLLQHSRDSGKVAIIPVDCKTENIAFTRLTFGRIMAASHHNQSNNLHDLPLRLVKGDQ